MNNKVLISSLGLLGLLILATGIVWYLTFNKPSSTQEQQNVPTGKAEFKEFLVAGEELKFSPDQLVVDRGDKVRITFKSIKGIHGFKIDEYNAVTAELSEGKMETVEFVAAKPGKFSFYCPVGNHRGLGMRGTLVVN